MALNIFKVVHEEDPREAILREVGDLSGFEIAVQGVLVGTYKRPETKTEGGILIAGEVVKDDEYQSKVGLVLKVGNMAFVDEGDIHWHGFKAEPGDWVVFRASDGMKFAILGPGGRHCRLISDAYIRMKIPNPDMVF